MFSFEDSRDRYAYAYPLLYRWLMLKTQGKSPADFFVRHGIQELSIYGAGEIGELFFHEIKMVENLKIRCFIDKRADFYPNGLFEIPVKTPIRYAAESIGEKLVITPVFHMASITAELSDYGVLPECMLSLNQVIDGCR